MISPPAELIGETMTYLIPVTKGSALFVLMIGVTAPKLPAEEWSIPIAGNAFLTRLARDHDGEPTEVAAETGRGGRGWRSREGLRRDGQLVLTESGGKYSIYFRVDRPANLSLSIRANMTDAAATLVTRVGEHSFSTRIDNLVEDTCKLGTIKISRPGYVRVDLGLEPSSAGDELLARDFIVDSDTEELQLVYVRSNEGNMFYWGRRGPSVHLRYEVPGDRQLQFAYSEVTVRADEDSIGSFFMANGFGEGYFGFQVNSPSERRVLFSVWSPFRTDNPRDIPVDQRITTRGRGVDVHIGEFGNEGSGGQSYLVFPWKSDTTYRFLTEVRPDGAGNTLYTSWFGEKASDQWRLIASFRRPQTETYLRGFHSFLENFNPSYGHVTRRAHYGNVWVRDTQGQWHECTRARFSVDATGRDRQRIDFVGGADGDRFYLRNCGFFDQTGRPGETFARESSADGPPAIAVDELPRD